MSKAERAASALLDRLGVTAPPIDVDAVAHRLGIVVTRENLAADLSGLLIRPPGQTPVIGVNTVHHKRRQRFTIAHELGHNELGHAGELIVDSGVRVNKRDADSHTATVRDERDANAFAAALLMPAGLLQEQLGGLLAQGRAPSRVVAMLAKTFDVSEEAMHYRLLNLGMLNH